MRDEMDALVGASARINDADVEALSLRPAEADLMEEIMSTPALETVQGGGGPPRRRWASGRRLAIAGVAAVTIAAAFAVQSSRDTGPVWAASMAAIADAAPRLLIGDSDWEIRNADVATGSGFVKFVNGDASLTLKWSSTRDYDEIIADLREINKDSYITVDPPDPDFPDGGGVVEPTTVLGHEAHRSYGGLQRVAPDPFLDAPELAEEPSDIEWHFYRDETAGWYPEDVGVTTYWQQDGYVVRADTLGMDVAGHEAVVGALEPAGVNTWLDALPDDIVGPDDLDGVVEELLTDVPLPDDANPNSLVDPGRISQRDLIAADVRDALACEWVGRWIDANGEGDEAAAEEAATVLAGARDWSQLWEELTLDTGLIEYADAIANEGRLYDSLVVSTVGDDGGEVYIGAEDPEGTFSALFNCDSPSR